MPNLKLGIVGLPNVGKSTLFNALTAAGAAADNYPFCTVDPNIGVVEVPDARLDLLEQRLQPRARVPAVVTFVDIAGLVEGASTGEGLGNQFLANIREVHAIVHVVRCFEDPDVAHVLGSVDPARDRAIVNLELALSDLQLVERRLERVEKVARSGERAARAEADLLRRLHTVLSEGGPARRVAPQNEEELRLLRGYNLLTAKRVLYVANVAEGEMAAIEPRSNGERGTATANDRSAAGTNGNGAGTNRRAAGTNRRAAGTNGRDAGTNGSTAGTNGRDAGTNGSTAGTDLSAVGDEPGAADDDPGGAEIAEQTPMPRALVGSNPHLAALQTALAVDDEPAEIVPLSVRIEAELIELAPQDRTAFLQELGLEEPGLHRLIRAGYHLLDLISFFTASEKEVRAWTIRRGALAYDAAGEIHTDFARGFIRAETIGWSDFLATGDLKTAREQGLVRSEGKEYVVQDGDIILFRFNV